MKISNAYIWTILWLCGLTFSAHAQHKDGRWAFGVGYNQRDLSQIPNQEFKDFKFSDAFRIYIGRYLNPSFDLVLNTSFVPLVFENRTKEQLMDVDLNFRYKLNNGYIMAENALLAPYITLGFGANMQEEIAGVVNSAFPVGAGLRLNIGSIISMEVEGKYHINMGDFQDYASINYGFNFNFGKKRKAPNSSTLTDSRDADQDGVLDEEDACPDLAGPASLSGCPDSDRDGLADIEDKCPYEAGPRDRQGCPKVDTDKDGIYDEEDRCPEEAGFIQLNGCPDTDGDGLADLDDKCPDEVGEKENKGCPIAEKVKVSETIKNQLEMARDAVQFESGSSNLLEDSYSVLDLVVKIMKENPSFYLRITGYTDNSGGTNRNLLLSEKRAEACYLYLVKKGVRDGRIAYKGYGEAKAIAPNDTPEGRAKNRRVEFEILIPKTEADFQKN